MENKYFHNALQNFIFEEAGGGAIRHLANRGYTAKQIAQALSFPVPYEKVREAFTEYLMKENVLLREDPRTYREPERTEFVREYDKYGRASFRKVAISPKGDLPDKTFGAGKWRGMDFAEFLRLYQGGAGNIKLPREADFAETEKNVYIACGFGGEQGEELFAALEGEQYEYVQGICWKRRTMYHLLNRRMLEIAATLQGRGLSAGRVYLHSREQ